MADQLPAGPYRMIETDSGVQAPWYIIPFDEQGNCQGPLTQQQMFSTLTNDSYTDIFLFSHGWNNDWNDASTSYANFLAGYTKMRQDHALAYGRPFRPLLVGVFWPSIALVLPWESGPAFAGATDPHLQDEQVTLQQRELQSLARSIASSDLERFYALAQHSVGLSEDEALEFARILSPFYMAGGSDDLPAKGPPPAAVADIVKLWLTISAMSPSTTTAGKLKFTDDTPATPDGTATTPQAAGDLSALDPRIIIRLATVLQMKDRAGTVGAHGVCPMLQTLLANSGSAQLHLVGHSYGCKVILSALCYQDIPRPVHSIFLMQPAISYLCFAKDATGQGEPGGYHVALDRVEEPILTTFSSHDSALTQFFQLVVRRSSDLGEMQIAGVPPSRYAALGGYGPGGCDDICQEIPIKQEGDPYSLGSGATKIYALNGSNDAIHEHGDINNQYTWWALYQQVMN